MSQFNLEQFMLKQGTQENKQIDPMAVSRVTQLIREEKSIDEKAKSGSIAFLNQVVSTLNRGQLAHSYSILTGDIDNHLDNIEEQTKALSSVVYVMMRINEKLKLGRDLTDEEDVFFDDLEQAMGLGGDDDEDMQPSGYGGQGKFYRNSGSSRGSARRRNGSSRQLRY